MPKVSVIVPVYQAEEYLAECIESILGQSFWDLELILVDDGSPDNCYAICREYAEQDCRIRVLRQKNQGQAAARNHAMTVAEGDWICFVDSDDRIHPQMVEFLYSAAEQSGANISMCRYVEGARLPEDFLRERKPSYEVLNMDEQTLVTLYDREDYPGWVACTKLVTRKIVEGYPFTAGRVFEDNEAVSRWVCMTEKIADVNQHLYFYRKNQESTTKSGFSLKKLDYLWALESITEFYGSIGYGEMQRRFARRYADAAIESCYGVRHILGQPEKAKEIDKRARRFLRCQGIRLTRAEFEGLLDAAHPMLVKWYWPVAAVLRRLGFGKGDTR